MGIERTVKQVYNLSFVSYAKRSTDTYKEGQMKTMGRITGPKGFFIFLFMGIPVYFVVSSRISLGGWEEIWGGEGRWKEKVEG